LVVVGLNPTIEVATRLRKAFKVTWDEVDEGAEVPDPAY
jgi:hypothetical protein